MAVLSENVGMLSFRRSGASRVSRTQLFAARTFSRRGLLSIVAYAILTALLSSDLKAQNTRSDAQIADNGVRNATHFAGVDIGAQINAAFASCPHQQCTVFVPAGNYTYATPIVLPPVPSPTLEMDQQAFLHYTGNGRALSTSKQTGRVFIRGGHIIGNPAAKVGIMLLQETQGIYIDGTDVVRFSNGDGLLDLGANVVKLTNMQLRENLFGLHLMGAPGYASNNVTVSGCAIHDNTRWGIIDGDITQYPANWMGTGGVSGVASPLLGNVFINNDLEGNGRDPSGQYGAVLEALTYKSVYTGNYFEGSPHQVQLGYIPHDDAVYQALYGLKGPEGGTPVSATIRDNYFTAGSAIEVELLTAIDAVIDGNGELGANTSCFASITGAAGGTYIANNHLGGWPQANNNRGEWMQCHGTADRLRPGWENVDAVPTAFSVGGDSVYFNGKNSAGGATSQQMIRFTQDGPPRGFCTPAWSPGAIWMNTTTGEMWVCQADSIAPHGGAGNNAKDGHGSWVVK